MAEQKINIYRIYTAKMNVVLLHAQWWKNEIKLNDENYDDQCPKS